MDKKIPVPGDQKEWTKLLMAARFDGERFVIAGEEGALAAIVPLEDLDVIEKIES